MPPPSRRRTLPQIQAWFQMGNNQRRQIMDDEADTTIISSPSDDTIYWDGAWRTRPPLIPSTQKMCSGVSRAFIQNLDPSRYDDDAKARILLGFYHTFREGLTNRAEASNPANETWRHPSYVVGEITNLNDSADVRCIIVEAEHDGNENQYDFVSIHDVNCTFGAVAEGRSLCSICQAG